MTRSLYGREGIRFARPMRGRLLNGSLAARSPLKGIGTCCSDPYLAAEDHDGSMKERGAARRARDPAEDALRRWLGGQDRALEEWLNGRVHQVRHRPRTLATT